MFEVQEQEDGSNLVELAAFVLNILTIRLVSIKLK